MAIVAEDSEEGAIAVRRGGGRWPLWQRRGESTSRLGEAEGEERESRHAAGSWAGRQRTVDRGGLLSLGWKLTSIDTR